ncbi:MAG TPA: HAD family phosphatase [Burkholderiaceae bacterium]|nr:HAD family phosphatase [Burkholderiaceae bacterium]
MKLALFDLDHTLLPIDSADTWSHFLVRQAGLDADEYGARIGHFAATYKAGRFDIDGYLTFQMDLLARFPRPQLERWRDDFVREHVAPHVRAEAVQLIACHRADGFVLALVTGTHAFLTRAIADLFGIEHLLAVMPEEAEGKFTGRYVGTHTYQEGKVRAVHAFLAARGTTLADCADSIFYSDSINDLPLLEAVAHPVVTNGDARLRAVAAQRGWPTLDLFALVLGA